MAVAVGTAVASAVGAAVAVAVGMAVAVAVGMEASISEDVAMSSARVTVLPGRARFRASSSASPPVKYLFIGMHTSIYVSSLRGTTVTVMPRRTSSPGVKVA